MATAVLLGESGNLFAVGGVEVAGEGLNAWVQRLSSESGAPGWYDSYDGAGADDAAAAVALAPNGDILVCGRSTSAEDGTDLWVARLSSEGDRLGSFQVDMGQGLYDLVTDCVVHDDVLLISGLGFPSDAIQRDGFVGALSLSNADGPPS